MLNMNYKICQFHEQYFGSDQFNRHLSRPTIAWVNSAPIVRNSYTCIRLFQVQLTDKYQDEEHLLYVMTAADLNGYVKSNKLIDHINDVQNNCPAKQVALLVFGVKEFCRSNRNASRLDIETALTEVQLFNGISHRLMDTAEDVGHVVMQFSKSVAEIPYK